MQFHRNWVVTARHCVQDYQLEEDVTIEFKSSAPDGALLSAYTVAALLKQSHDGHDLALLFIKDPPNTFTADLGEAVDGALWQSPHTPSAQHPRLTGRIQFASTPLRLERGQDSNVMQLSCEGRISSFKGYSGGPIVGRSGTHSDKLLGILLEQDVNADSGDATSILYGASIRHISYVFGLDMLRMGETQSALLESRLAQDQDYTENPLKNHQREVVDKYLNELRELRDRGDMADISAWSSRLNSALAEVASVTEEELSDFRDRLLEPPAEGKHR